VSTLVLHIGYPKTGTTAVQAFLNANRDALRSRGVCYPATGQSDDHSHNRLVLGLTGSHDDGMAAALGGEIEQANCQTVVLSSELFLYRLEALVSPSRHLSQILSGHTLRAVCYVRRQDSFLESLYRQFVWDPGSRLSLDADDFLNSEYSNAGDYYVAVNAWAGFIGKTNFTPIVYEQALRSGGCIRAFCRAVGIDTDGLVDLDVQRNVNPSDRLSTEIMRVVNTFTELAEKDRVEIARGALGLDRVARDMPIPKRLFSGEQVAAIERRFMESNRRLADEYVRQPLDGFWFSETEPVPTA
jgi:hypothetical protein